MMIKEITTDMTPDTEAGAVPAAPRQRRSARTAAIMMFSGALGLAVTGCTVTDSNGAVRDATFSESVNQFFDNAAIAADVVGSAADLLCTLNPDCSSSSSGGDYASAPPPPPGKPAPGPRPGPRAQAGPGPKPKGGPQNKPQGGKPQGGKPQGGKPQGGKPQGGKPEEKRKDEPRPK